MTAKNPEMIVYRGVRYRMDVARRLGLVEDGKVLTPASREVPRVHKAAAGLITTEALNPEGTGTGEDTGTGEATGTGETTPDPAATEAQAAADAAKPLEDAAATGTPETGTQDPAVDAGPAPAMNGTKADWLKYAMALGKTPAQLEGLTRDAIIELTEAN